MNTGGILAICEDCNHSAEWEGGALTCRLIKGSNGGPIRPCAFRAFLIRPGAKCPIDKWQNFGRSLAAPASYRIGSQDVSIIPIAFSPTAPVNSEHGTADGSMAGERGGARA